MPVHRFMILPSALFTLLGAVSVGRAQVRSQAEAISGLPEDVLLALRSAARMAHVFSVSTNERFSGNVLRADEILFGEGAQLILDHPTAEWIVITAKKLRFQSPQKLSRLTVVGGKPPAGTVGAVGANGGHADAGSVGRPGGTGAIGQLPRLYVIVEELSLQGGDALQLEIVGNGIGGGAGGNGGPGGNGGGGDPGRNSRSNMLHCTRGAGREGGVVPQVAAVPAGLAGEVAMASR